ncbi:murein biosynthesis integral membrane protein MurJ [Candidatus Peregrinibacteria bacterium]|nr:murein biosynthesis integral membrane protein MurJ [Candidatus Peregrinibacteria bacterium]
MLLKLKNLFFRREKFASGAAILTITTFLSYLTGLLRDRIFARTFGAGRELDLYNTSFIVPDIMFNILIAGAFSAAFIPVFTGLLATGEKEKANKLANTTLNSAVLAILAVGVLAAIFMPVLAKFIAPGFNEIERGTLVSLSRLMLISPVIMTISSALGAILISQKTFLAYGLSPVFYNLGIISGTFLTPWFGIHGLVIGTLTGAGLHFLPRLISIFYAQYKYLFLFNIRDPSFIKIIKLLIPKMIGHPVEQFTFLAFNRIATGLVAGSIAVISFARNFQSVAVSLFGIAFSVAIFPMLSECAAKGDRENFLKNFWKALRDILIFTVPSALGLYLLSDLIIRIFLGGGKFSDENIMRTAQVLSVFAFSIPTESLIHLLARAFYALKNTIIPVALSLLGLAVAVIFASFKAKTIGILAIPYGFFLGSAIEVILMSFLLHRYVKKVKS